MFVAASFMIVLLISPDAVIDNRYYFCSRSNFDPLKDLLDFFHIKDSLIKSSTSIGRHNFQANINETTAGRGSPGETSRRRREAPTEAVGNRPRRQPRPY